MKSNLHRCTLVEENTQCLIALIFHSTDAVFTIFEFVEEYRNVGVIYRLLAVIGLEIDFGLIGLNRSVVDEDLVPRAVAIGSAGRHAFFQFIASFVAGVSIDDHATVSEPFVMHDLTDPKERCSSFVVIHDQPLNVSPVPVCLRPLQYLICRMICV